MKYLKEETTGKILARVQSNIFDCVLSEINKVFGTKCVVEELPSDTLIYCNFKIIGVSNFDLETVNDILIMDGITKEATATKLADAWNASMCNSDACPTYYRDVTESHKLYAYDYL